MIVIHFECDKCGCKDGELSSSISGPFIFCRACEEEEELTDFDIVSTGTFDPEDPAGIFAKQ